MMTKYSWIMRKPAWLLGGLIALASNLSAPLLADETTKAILILDASGSMWGQINGKTKIEIARESVAQVLEGLGPNIELGLMAYGHRRKGDCDDIELLIPPGPVDKAAFLQKVNSLTPLGNTPLTKAVQMAAEALKSEENPATVILVSDGLETCNGDPCALAAKLESTGIKFTTHVVAFDLTQQESRKIDCLAKLTGGLFLPASDAGTLKRALGAAVESVNTVKSGASFLAKNARTGEALDSAQWTVSKNTGEQVASSAKAAFGQELEPGEYVAVAQWQEQKREVPFTVKKGLIQPVEASFGPAVVRLIAAESADSPPLTSEDTMFFWSVVPILPDGSRGEEQKASREQEPLLELAAGKYVVKFERGSNVNRGTASVEEPIEVKDGETRTIRVIAPMGTVQITTSYGGIPFTESEAPWVEARPILADGTISDQVVVNIAEQPVTGFFSPGKYELRSTLHGATATAQIEVKAGAKDSLTLDYDAGYVECSLELGGNISTESWWWTVYPIDAEGQRGTAIYTVSNAQPKILLPTGVFEIVREAQNADAGSVKITVERGKTVKAVVKAP